MNTMLRTLYMSLLTLIIGCASAVTGPVEDELPTLEEVTFTPEPAEERAPTLAIDPEFAAWHLPVIEAAVEELFAEFPSLRVPVVIGTEGTIVIKYEGGDGPVSPETGRHILGRVLEDKVIRIWSDWMKNDVLRVVTLHELGHRFGAAHLDEPTDPRSVMAPSVSGWASTRCLTKEDAAAICATCERTGSSCGSD